MSLRSRLKSIARRLPVTGAYQRRIDVLRHDIESLQARAEHLSDRLHKAIHNLPDEELSNGSVRTTLLYPPGHFYSPIVDQGDIEQRGTQIFGRDPLALPAVHLDIASQWSTFEQLAALMTDLDFAPDRATANARGHRYWTENPAYGDGDASALAAMLRLIKPQRLIELGCGYSSACTLDTRERFLGDTPHITFVDPYPELLNDITRGAGERNVDVKAFTTQDVPVEWVEQLRENDVLFIDSTHVTKTGSDVNRIFFELLPALKPGAVIHLHDVFPGFEYPRAWVEEGRSWNELYLLRAFLQYNDAFEVMCFPGLLRDLDPARHSALAPHITNPGGACWLRKVR